MAVEIERDGPHKYMIRDISGFLFPRHNLEASVHPASRSHITASDTALGG
jgi:hypothetical protein